MKSLFLNYLFFGFSALQFLFTYGWNIQYKYMYKNACCIVFFETAAVSQSQPQVPTRKSQAFIDLDNHT